MKAFSSRRHRAHPAADLVLPRSIGIMIAVVGSLFCWAMLVELVRTIG